MKPKRNRASSRNNATSARVGVHVRTPGNREADQRLWFRYTDSTIPLLHKSEILSL